MFSRVNNLVITGGSFTNYNENNENKGDPVTTVLLRHVATGAIFDSAERHPPGRCHPGTRQMVMNRITKWLKNPNPAQRILWLYGPAGAGKSALMQATCELLRDSDPGMNGGSFFFARGNTDRSKGDRLFVTLSYQLAVQIPSVREEITEALNRDPSLPTKSLDIQLRFLIINPLLRCQPFPSRIPILFIDGLDECDYDSDRGADTQCEIIALISKSIVEHNIPVRFIIASRPEYWIRETFRASPVSAITFPLSLRDDTDADKDIKSYLTDTFEKIRQENGRIMQQVALPWPPTHIIDQFVHDASGQYIYASTILKFVGKHSPFSDPQEQLRIIITPGCHRAVAFSELDRLYSTILSVYPRWETMRCVLGGLLIGVDLTVIRVVLKISKTEITLVLDALSSLIESNYNKRISFCHTSFREFLLDETRSGPYHIDVRAMSAHVISASVGIIQRNLAQNHKNEFLLSHDTTWPEYEMLMSSISTQTISCGWEFLPDHIPVFHDLLEALRRCNAGMRADHPQCFVQDMATLQSIFTGVDYETGFVAKNSSASFLRLTNKLRILAFAANDTHRYSSIFYIFCRKEEWVVWVVWPWWRAEYLCIWIYVWVWSGLWRMRMRASKPQFFYLGYTFCRYMLMALALELLYHPAFGKLEWFLRGYRCILVSSWLFYIWALSGLYEPLRLGPESLTP